LSWKKHELVVVDAVGRIFDKLISEWKVKADKTLNVKLYTLENEN
jgi:hypothetical protein